MIKTILSIIGIIAIIWFLCVHIANIALYIVYKVTNGLTYTALVRAIAIYNTTDGEWYIIPAVSFYNDNGFFNLTISFIKWNFIIEYHFRTEEEETLYYQAKRELDEEIKSKKQK